jgi:death-on-curing protein
MAKELTTTQILHIHQYLTEWFEKSDDPISPPGIKNIDLLESAVARPSQSAGGKDQYITPFEKAAALFHSIINNHSFHNGNKRTGLIAACVTLDSYGHWLERCSDEELFEFTRMTAAHELCENRTEEVPVISDWFEKNSRKRTKMEKQLKFNELRDILSSFGFDVDPPSGERINIYKDGNHVETILKRGIQGFQPYDTHYISGLRKRLDLTPEYNVDSEVFYGGLLSEDTLSEIMEIRGEVVRRLAKT